MIKIDFGFGCEFDKDGHGISRDESFAALRKIRSEAARIFGSYTLQQTFGGWTNAQGGLVQEDGYTLFTVQPETRETLDSDIERLADFVKIILNQEAVAVTTSKVNFKLL